MSFFWEKYVANDLQIMCLQRGNKQCNTTTKIYYMYIPTEIYMIRHDTSVFLTDHNERHIQSNVDISSWIYYLPKKFIFIVLESIFRQNDIYLFLAVAYHIFLWLSKYDLSFKACYLVPNSNLNFKFLFHSSLCTYTTLNLICKTTFSCFGWINYPTFL